MKTMIANSRTETGDMIETAKAKIKRVKKSTDDSQFLNARGQLGFRATDSLAALDESTFNSEIAEAIAVTEAREHMASHDEGGLQKLLDKVSSDLAETLAKHH